VLIIKTHADVLEIDIILNPTDIYIKTKEIPWREDLDMKGFGGSYLTSG
jgi:hypothetical protein